MCRINVQNLHKTFPQKKPLSLWYKTHPPGPPPHLWLDAINLLGLLITTSDTRGSPRG